MVCRGNKSRKRAKGYLDRKAPSLRQKIRFLIVCEGQTEKSYFDKFVIPSVDIQAKETGRSTASIVKEAISLKKNGEYDQVWCVFDKDDNKECHQKGTE